MVRVLHAAHSLTLSWQADWHVDQEQVHWGSWQGKCGWGTVKGYGMYLIYVYECFNEVSVADIMKV